MPPGRRKFGWVIPSVSSCERYQALYQDASDSRLWGIFRDRIMPQGHRCDEDMSLSLPALPIIARPSGDEILASMDIPKVERWGGTADIPNG